MAGDHYLKETTFFVSDTHFKYETESTEEQSKQKRFLDFLAGISGASQLYLLGDIFDFWFEYRSVVPRYYHDILDALATLKKNGTGIFLAGGNHDFWFGPYIRRTLGFNVLPPLATHEIQGRVITMTHGDTLLPGDLAYKSLKTLIRSRPAIACARAIHPDILYGFAKRFSRASKHITEKKTERSARILLDLARDSFFKWGNDVFIMGHIHYPCLENFGEKTFVILGDWERHCSYLELADGRLSLRFYRPGEKTVSENR
jgi:UDP-2,3-diacylglucosamine hydrolase